MYAVWFSFRLIEPFENYILVEILVLFNYHLENQSNSINLNSLNRPH